MKADGRPLGTKVFTRHKDGWPYSGMVVDYDAADLPDHRYATTVLIPYAAYENGWPTKREFNRIYKIETRLTAALKVFRAVSIGNLAGRGQAMIIFRSPAPLPSSIDVRSGLWARQTYSLLTRDDPDWMWHETEVLLSAQNEHGAESSHFERGQED